MPRVELHDAIGTAYRIDTLSEPLLKSWLDEWLPRLHRDDCATMILVWPQFDGHGSPDWLTDSRVIGELVPITALNGEQGLEFIQQLRAQLLIRLAEIKKDRGH